MAQFFVRHDSKYTKKPLSQDDLRIFEERHGLRFPACLRAGLLKMNGGEMTPNTFKIGSGIYLIPGFQGVILDGPGWPRLHPLSDYAGEDKYEGWPVPLPRKEDDAKKIFLFEYLFEEEAYYALNWNEKSGEPSVWYLRKDNAIKLANSWDELMAAAYAGDSNPCIKFGEGWDGYTILLDTRSAAGAGQGVILGTRDNEIRIQESQIISNFKDRSYPYLSEYAFPGSYVDLAGLSLSQAHEENRFPYHLHIHTKRKAVCHSSQKHSGEWMNDEQPDFCDAWLGVERLDDALKAFKKLYEMACMGQGKKKRRT